MKDQLNLGVFTTNRSIQGGKWGNGSSSNIRERVGMDWVDKAQNFKHLYGILNLLRGSHLNNFAL